MLADDGLHGRIVARRALRSILNDFPEWLLALLFIGAIVALTLGAYALVSRFLPDWRNRENLEGILAVGGMSMTLFALVLAFVVVNLYDDYTSASADVTDEANALGAIVQDARAFPPLAHRGEPAHPARPTTAPSTSPSSSWSR